MLEQLAVGYAVTFALSVARLGGFVTVSPLPGEQAPLSTRVGLVMVLAVVITPLVRPPAGGLDLGLALVIPAATELGLGLLVGVAFRFVLAAADVLGGVLSQAVGIGMPSLFNPTAGVQDTAIGQIYGLFTLLLALGLGAHRVALAYLLESFQALPVGSVLHLERSVPVMVELAGTTVAVGARLAMPVVATAVALYLVLALLARAAPSMQLFSIGFTVLLLVGFSTMIASAPSIGQGLAEHIGLLGSVLDRLLTSVSPWR